jgi:hypothetical protein
VRDEGAMKLPEGLCDKIALGLILKDFIDFNIIIMDLNLFDDRRLRIPALGA